MQNPRIICVQLFKHLLLLLLLQDGQFPQQSPASKLGVDGRCQTERTGDLPSSGERKERNHHDMITPDRSLLEDRSAGLTAAWLGRLQRSSDMSSS